MSVAVYLVKLILVAVRILDFDFDGDLSFMLRGFMHAYISNAEDLQSGGPLVGG